MLIVPKSHWHRTAHERTAYDDRIRQLQRLTECRLLGYQVKIDWLLLCLDQLRALADVLSVHHQPD